MRKRQEEDQESRPFGSPMRSWRRQHGNHHAALPDSNWVPKDGWRHWVGTVQCSATPINGMSWLCRRASTNLLVNTCHQRTTGRSRPGSWLQRTLLRTLQSCNYDSRGSLKNNVEHKLISSTWTPPNTRASVHLAYTNLNYFVIWPSK